MIRLQTLFLLLLFTQQLLSQSSQDLVKKNLNDLIIVIPGAGSEPGIGDNDGLPAGTEIQLPAGVRFVQRPGKAFDPDLKNLYGNANTFYADVNMEIDRAKVKTGAPVQMTFEPGLVMLNTAPSRIQNGMLMDRVRVNMPPTGIGAGGLKDTVTVYLGLVCLNEGFGLPWEENVNGPVDIRDYPIGMGMYMPYKITSHKGLLMLANLLAEYPKLRLTRHYNPQLQFQDDYVEPEWKKIYGSIQEMVWKVTNGPGITKGELDKFKKELEPYR